MQQTDYFNFIFPFFFQEIRVNGETFNKSIAFQMRNSDGKYSQVARYGFK